MSGPSSTAWRTSAGYVCVFCSTRRTIPEATVRANGCSSTRIRRQRQTRQVHSTPQQAASQSSAAVTTPQHNDDVSVSGGQFSSAVTFGTPSSATKWERPAPLANKWALKPKPASGSPASLSRQSILQSIHPQAPATQAPPNPYARAPPPPPPTIFSTPAEVRPRSQLEPEPVVAQNTSSPAPVVSEPISSPINSTSDAVTTQSGALPIASSPGLGVQPDALPTASTAAPKKRFGVIDNNLVNMIKDYLYKAAPEDRLAICQEELAIDYPKHSAGEWLNHFNTAFLPQMEAEAAAKKPLPASELPDAGPRPVSASKVAAPEPTSQTLEAQGRVPARPSLLSSSRLQEHYDTPQPQVMPPPTQNLPSGLFDEPAPVVPERPSPILFGASTAASKWGRSAAKVDEAQPAASNRPAPILFGKPSTTAGQWGRPAAKSSTPSSLPPTANSVPFFGKVSVQDRTTASSVPLPEVDQDIPSAWGTEIKSTPQDASPSTKKRSDGMGLFATLQNHLARPPAPEGSIVSFKDRIGGPRPATSQPLKPQVGIDRWRKPEAAGAVAQSSPAISFTTPKPEPAPTNSLRVSFDARLNAHATKPHRNFPEVPEASGWSGYSQEQPEKKSWQDESQAPVTSWNRKPSLTGPAVSWSESAPSRDDRARYAQEAGLDTVSQGEYGLPVSNDGYDRPSVPAGYDLPSGYDLPAGEWDLGVRPRAREVTPDDSDAWARKTKKDKESQAAEDKWQQKKSMKAKDKARSGREFIAGDFVAKEVDEGFEMSKAERKALKRQKREEAAILARDTPTPVYLPEFISIANLAQTLAIRLEDFMAKLTELGFEDLASDQILDSENAGLIAMEYNYDPIIENTEDMDLVARPPPEDKSILPSRPPVVTIMGHVDHGKTTILDWLRKSSVASGEAGGITQAIGAFSVTMPSGKVITFLDTPGHEAFLSMRQRGANVTDIVILVVAADDSVMPQTKEAIKHARAAKVPMIVAINKCDKEDADVDRVKRDLAANDVDVEDFGGETQVIEVSGKTGLGMENLEECTILQSELLDVRADTEGFVEGWVIEATTKSRGRVATVLVKQGTLRKGDILVAGKTWARVRSLLSENGTELESAPPGTPVEVDGWREQPDAGDEVLQAPSENKAKDVVEYRITKEERDRLTEDMEAINKHRRLQREKEEREAFVAEQAALGITAPDEEAKPTWIEVPFIIKGDVSGSVEAVSASVLAIGNDEIRSKIVKSGVGAVTESDIEMAQTTGAICLAFNTPAEPHIDSIARNSGVTMVENNIIYRLTEEVKKVMSARLPPTITRTVTGEAEILQVFQINVKGKQYKPVAGCKVRNNVVKRNSRVRVLRGKDIVYDGTIDSLKNVKKDVAEMKKDTECGIGFKDWYGFEEGDKIQCYEEKSTPRVLT